MKQFRHPLDMAISPEMETARRALAAAGIKFEQKSEYQIKVGSINFYPNNGKITIDGLPTILEQGLHAFLVLAIASQKGQDPRVLATVNKDRPRLNGGAAE